MDGWKTAHDTAAAAGRLGNRLPADAHHTTVPPSVTPGSVFMFQRRRVPINWRHLAGLDVDRVCREMDVQALQQNIANVTFCDVESEDFRGVDGNFVKLFRLAQLTIEYLLHSQQYLSDQKNQFEQQVHQLQKEVEVCQSEASARAEEMKTIKRENRRRRKMIEAYQDMLSQGATGLHPCPVCSKEFVSQQYLDSHMQRRHPAHLQPTATKQGPSQEEIEKKLLEQMNERFRAAEQQLREELANTVQHTFLHKTGHCV
jgi:zinc finger protein DZIP1